MGHKGSIVLIVAACELSISDAEQAVVGGTEPMVDGSSGSSASFSGDTGYCPSFFWAEILISFTAGQEMP